MWAFGVGLFMVIISPESLRVTAIYGLSMGGAILLFGALVGDWLDRTPRLKGTVCVASPVVGMVLHEGAKNSLSAFETTKAVWVPPLT